jgi:hypothetical protein
MVSKKIQGIIVKYLINEASSSELDELELWIDNPANEKEFINYVRANYAIEFNLKKFDSNSTIKKLDKLLKEEKRVVRLRRIQRYSKYAAVFIGVMISVYLFREEIFKNAVQDNHEIPIIVNVPIEPGTDKATLTLENGTQVVLEKGTSYQTQNANSNGEQIVYQQNKKDSKQIVYNHLTIPRGGQFHIVLSDGTEVWLNSESQLKYPVTFVDGQTREVELVYGEAYFDVSPSLKHNGTKFIVLNKAQNVEVLGTEFNIKAYKDEANIYTTLVEGRVSVHADAQKQNLQPSQQSNLNLEDKSIVVAKVDVYNEISWKEGVFSFEQKTLEEIMKVLSRWYDIEVVFQNETIKDQEFVGVLRKNQSIEEILTIIKNFGIIKNFEVLNNEQKIILE